MKSSVLGTRAIFICLRFILGEGGLSFRSVSEFWCPLSSRVFSLCYYLSVILPAIRKSKQILFLCKGPYFWMLISLSFIFNCVHMNVSVHVLSPGAPNPEEGIFFYYSEPAWQVTVDSLPSPHVSSGTQTQVLWKKEQQVLLTTEPPLQPQRQFSSQSIPSPMWLFSGLRTPQYCYLGTKITPTLPSSYKIYSFQVGRKSTWSNNEKRPRAHRAVIYFCHCEILSLQTPAFP